MLREAQWMERRRLISAVTLLLVFSVAENSMALDKVSYAVTMQEGQIELRDYPAAVVAVVVVDGTRSHAVNAGFRLLADYIFGNNQKSSKIDMTAPVTQMHRLAQPGTPAMTPVPDAHPWTVSFFMPAGYTLQTLPEPNDDRVHFEQPRARKVAAIRFSGFWSDANLKAHENQLVQWMHERNLVAVSEPIYAYYNPPWTPWFLRRIEVLIEIAPTL
jgi:SOUL heme-binding protein